MRGENHTNLFELPPKHLGTSKKTNLQGLRRQHVTQPDSTSYNHYLDLRLHVTHAEINEKKVTQKDHISQMSHEKNPLTFHFTGCLMGLLIMAYYNPHITG